MARIVIAALLFGISFGYVEAAVVVYLRALYDPIRQIAHPGTAPGDQFPLLTDQQVAALGPEHVRRVDIEIAREAATMVMLIAFAIAIGSSFNQRVAVWAIAFGLWDISFYVFLKLLVGWPASLATWDILFLIPRPWAAPVWAPVLISATMIVCGLVSLRFGGIAGRPLHWAALLAGAFLMMLAFMWDYRNIDAGGLPNPFEWPVLLAGEALGLTGFVAAARNREYRESQKPRDSR